MHCLRIQKIFFDADIKDSVFVMPRHNVLSSGNGDCHAAFDVGQGVVQRIGSVESEPESESRHNAQLLSRDYLIMDTFVIKKEAFRNRHTKTLTVFAKVPYGMNRHFRVSSSVYNAVTANMPGFLIRYDTKKPVHQGTAKIFYPAIPVA